IWGSAGGSELKTIGVWPATVEATAGPAPLKGTCTRSRPFVWRNCSPARCPGVPAPADPKLYRPGLALASSTSSLTVLDGPAGLTEGGVAAATGRVIGSKSFGS